MGLTGVKRLRQRNVQPEQSQDSDGTTVHEPVTVGGVTAWTPALTARVDQSATSGSGVDDGGEHVRRTRDGTQGQCAVVSRVPLPP